MPKMNKIFHIIRWVGDALASWPPMSALGLQDIIKTVSIIICIEATDTVQFCFRSGRLTCSARTGSRAVTTPLVCLFLFSAQTQNVIGGFSRNFEEVDRGPSYGVVCMHSTECRLLQCLIMYKHVCKLTFRTSIPLTRRKICMLVPHSNFKRIFGIGK